MKVLMTECLIEEQAIKCLTNQILKSIKLINAYSRLMFTIYPNDFDNSLKFAETSLTLKQFQDAQQGYLKVLDLYINNYDIANNDTWHQADEFLAMIGKTEIVFHNPLHLQDDEFLYQYGKYLANPHCKDISPLIMNQILSKDFQTAELRIGLQVVKKAAVDVSFYPSLHKFVEFTLDQGYWHI